MKLFEGKSPAERNKLILAMALGVLALASIFFMFFSSSSSPKTKNQNTNNKTTQAERPADLPVTRSGDLPSPSEARADAEVLSPPIPVVFTPSSYVAPGPGRNIFAFYVAPSPPPKAPSPPPPTPTPPLVLSSVSPATVYARTGDFSLEVYGDKFTSASAILVDNSALPTRYVNAQQLSATMPASMIANDGARQIRVSTPDGLLYSTTTALMVMAPPMPDYLYIGIIGKAHYNDTAVLKDKGNPKELLNVQRGDMIGGRFRVTSISEREIALTDTTLQIRHTLPFTEEKGGQSTSTRPTGNNRTPLNSNDSGIPGIPNVPRYQPPGRTEQLQEAEEGEEAPGIPSKGGKP